MLSFGEGGTGGGDARKNASFSRKKTFFRQIFNQFTVCMWSACCNRLKNTQKVEISDENFYKFLKNRIFQKLTTDLENRRKLQVETKTCVFLDMDC